MKNPFALQRFFNQGLVVTFLVLISSLSSVYGQGFGNSPYSTFGVGEIFSGAQANFQGMGGSGVSVANGIYSNNLNPALLAQNKFTVFEVGMLGQAKQIKDNNESQREYGGNLHYLNLTLPIAKKGAIALNLQPYSVVDYESRFTKKAQGPSPTDVTYIYKGQGAINRFSLSGGVNPTKGLFIGGGINFYFGNIFKETVSSLNDESIFRLTYTDRASINGVGYRTGAAYKHKIAEKWFLNVGGTYELNAKLKQNTLQTSLASVSDNGTFVPYAAIDTLGQKIGGSLTLPSKYRLGLSLESPYKVVFSADYEVQNWNNFKNNGQADPRLRNTQSFHIGTEYLPDANALSFWKKSTYRFGLSSGTLPYFINNQQVKDRNATLGFMFPAGRSLSYINVSFVAGERGGNSIIQERYVRMVFGLTLNDKWFYKMRID